MTKMMMMMMMMMMIMMMIMMMMVMVMMVMMMMKEVMMMKKYPKFLPLLRKWIASQRLRMTGSQSWPRRFLNQRVKRKERENVKQGIRMKNEMYLGTKIGTLAKSWMILK